MMKDTVFISHATPADNTFAVWLATKLELCGYRVWVDINNLPPSVDFWNTIDQTIRNEAVKFIFVTSHTSVMPDRDGVQKELAVADKVRKQDANFIIPVRIDDVDFGSFPVEILRLNAIDFNDNWAAGLDTLLDYLGKENVPKANLRRESEVYLNRWHTSQRARQQIIVDNEDLYCSNLFAVELPPNVYIYHRDDVESALAFRHIPMKKCKSLIITFACYRCLSEWVGTNVEYQQINIEKAINNCTHKEVFWGETIDNLSHDIISIINWTIGEMQFKQGMIRYRDDSRKTSRNVYYFPDGRKSKRFPSSREKVLSGNFRGKRWHFGLSGVYTQRPTNGIIFKWHIIFTDKDGHCMPINAQIAARRSKGRLMFNKQWKELLQASMYALSGGAEYIFCQTCCETNSMYIKSQSERFVSGKKYIEPVSYRQEKEDG